MPRVFILKTFFLRQSLEGLPQASSVSWALAGDEYLESFNSYLPAKSRQEAQSSGVPNAGPVPRTLGARVGMLPAVPVSWFFKLSQEEVGANQRSFAKSRTQEPQQDLGSASAPTTKTQECFLLCNKRQVGNKMTCFSQLCRHLPGKPSDLLTLCEPLRRASPQPEPDTTLLPGVSGTAAKTRKPRSAFLSRSISLPGTCL